MVAPFEDGKTADAVCKREAAIFLRWGTKSFGKGLSSSGGAVLKRDQAHPLKNSQRTPIGVEQTPYKVIESP